MREEQKNIGNFIEKYLKEDGESEYKEIIKRYEKEEGKSEKEFWEEMKKYAEEVMREKEISEDELGKIAGGVKYGKLSKKGKQMVSYLLVASSMLGQTGGMKASAAMPKQGIDIIKDGKNKEIKFFKEKPKIAIPATAAAAIGTTVAGAAVIGTGIYFLGKKLLAGGGSSVVTLLDPVKRAIWNGENSGKLEIKSEYPSEYLRDSSSIGAADVMGIILNENFEVIAGLSDAQNIINTKKSEIENILLEDLRVKAEFDSGESIYLDLGNNKSVVVTKMQCSNVSSAQVISTYASMVDLAIKNGKKSLAIGIPADLFPKDLSNEDKNKIISAALSGIKAGFNSNPGKSMGISLVGWPNFEKVEESPKVTSTTSESSDDGGEGEEGEKDTQNTGKGEEGGKDTQNTGKGEKPPPPLLNSEVIVQNMLREYEGAETDRKTLESKIAGLLDGKDKLEEKIKEQLRLSNFILSAINQINQKKEQSEKDALWNKLADLSLEKSEEELWKDLNIAKPKPKPTANSSGFLGDINSGGFQLKKVGETSKPKGNTEEAKEEYIGMIVESLKQKVDTDDNEPSSESSEDWLT